MSADSTQAQAERIEWLTIAQLLLSALALLGSLAAAALLLVTASGALTGQAFDQLTQTALLQMGWISALAALLCLPSLVLSLLRLFGKPVRGRLARGLRIASLLMLVWPLILAIGMRLPSATPITTWLIPPLAILAVGLPIWWLVELAQRKIADHSPQRGWGLWLGSAYITMPLVLIFELVLFAVLGVLAVAWLSQRPELAQRMEEIMQQLLLSSTGSPEEMVEAVRPYLQNPLVLAGILSLIALLVPMMEEALKPLAMLALWSRRPSPAQGFAAGAVCGGTFALLESLFSVAGPAAEGWVGLAITRSGTALLHIACSALVGWGLSKAWHGKGLNLIAAYAISVFFHATWNTFSVFTGLGFLAGDMPANIRFLNGPIQAAPVVLITLVVILFGFLWRGNRIVRRQMVQD